MPSDFLQIVTSYNSEFPYVSHKTLDQRPIYTRRSVLLITIKEQSDPLCFPSFLLNNNFDDRRQNLHKSSEITRMTATYGGCCTT